MNFKAEAEGVKPDQITQHLLKKAGIHTS
jgi:hypothetical protein